MTDKVDTLIWFYDDKGRIKNMKLQKIIESSDDWKNFKAMKKASVH